MLIVRCPACHTVFRVRPEQLRAHGGRVRCGSCYGAFNAVEHLMDQERAPDPGAHDAAPSDGRAEAPQPPSPAPSSAAPQTSIDEDGLDFGIPEPAASATRDYPKPSVPGNDPQPRAEHSHHATEWPALDRISETHDGIFRPNAEPQPRPSSPDPFVRKTSGTAAAAHSPSSRWNHEPDTEPTPEPVTLQGESVTLPVDAADPPSLDAADATPASPTPESGAAIPSPYAVRDEDPDDATDPPLEPDRGDTDDADDADDTPPFLHPAEPQVRHRWLWGLATGMLAGALAVQAAYLFREDIARKWPQTRPWYLELCAHLGCAVPLPRVPSAITIESSNLESDPADARQFVLSARVRNQAQHPQQYPHLELTLTDGRDRPVVRRVITPQEWVPGGVDESGMAPRAEIEASVPFEAKGPVSAVGYRVYAFYP